MTDITYVPTKEGWLYLCAFRDVYSRVIIGWSMSDNDLVCSMSSVGCCYDNAAMESFFHTLKVELVHEQRYETREIAKTL